MTAMELAMRYMDIVFGGGDLDALQKIMTENLEFRGPFVQFDSSSDYIESLKSDPPHGFSWTLISSFENETSACLFYRFERAGVSTDMAQLFDEVNGRIRRIVLVFDTAPFREEAAEERGA